ncbi:cytochrome P450, putative [Pediculus humanus corporis]|uniref:Cytochrome P450, putative n=1 Tax=Pediculus humanus subsp. corporis TaxID=121224 RepID=E0V9X5_PEDHC|nr:cytochrome P450, putative [Pediculus humanus corporis]EEB10181.1 cytochrome P450, putative [Pediculus humanus corporis]
MVKYMVHPKIIKEILDTNSDNFKDVRVNSENSIILKDSLLSLCGGEKSEVQILTNSLLNPQKLGKLFPKLVSSVEILIRTISKNRQENNCLDVTSSISEFIDDAVANSIFGIELDADVEFKEEFVNNSRKIFSVSDPNALTSLRFVLYENYFKEFWICPEKTLQYFVNLAITGITDTTANLNSILEEKSSSLVQLLVEAAEEEKKLKIKKKDDEEDDSDDVILKDNVIISKCIATMLSLSNATKTTVILDIQNLNYLDKIVKEVLRLYPFEFRLEKLCVKKTVIGNVEVDENVKVSIPLYALHRSEDIYPEPEKFEPERFAENSSENPSPFSYLPFGQAGINGSDFSIQLGILASKLTLFKLIEKFQFSIEQKDKSLSGLFKQGLTRIPRPEKIELFVKNRGEEEEEEGNNTNN